MNAQPDHPDDLLPWYANDTLAGAERERVEAHLSACPRCRDELKLLKMVRAGVQSTPVEPPTEFGLKRLLRDVRREAPHTARPRLWWQPALAAAALVIVIQGMLLINLWPRDSGIVPLGEPPIAHLQVRFAPQATEAEMRAVLAAVDGVIVDGPGALGLYRIRLTGGADSEAVASALHTLRAQAPVVAEASPEPR
ncbi:MAG TPA: zf-HC2 domain-containing protein [Acidiferrobacterales bacterium]